MKNKKAFKLVSLFAILCLMLNFFALAGFADDTQAPETVDVKVTLANQGEFVTAYSDLTVDDADEDGSFTINDVLICAHDKYAEGGKDDYETEITKWGLGIKKLCGVENGGSYGYYVNDVGAWSLEDTVKDGDYVYAFVYTDAENYTDRYSYFDKVTESAVPGDEISLVLTSLELDLTTYASVPTPLSDATIIIDGEETEYVTDSEGKVTIEAPEGLGRHIVSAKDPNGIIAPPVFVIDILEGQFFVTLANQGKLEVAYQEFTVTDADNDGAITINDALIVAHTEAFSGGADGYETEITKWGLGIKKLCGVENGGSYGYYVDNVSAWSLEDKLEKEGSHVYAFVYTDAENFSDKFSYFDKNTVEATEDDEITLTLTKNDFDENWNTVLKPVSGAIITVDGVETEYKTDENGVVTIKFSKGDHVVSAVSKDELISPPVLLATITEGAPAAGEEPATTPSSSVDVEIPKTGSNSVTLGFAVLGVLALTSCAVVLKKKDEE